MFENAVTVSAEYKPPSWELCATVMAGVFAVHFATYGISSNVSAFRALKPSDKLVWCTDIVFGLVTLVLMVLYPLAMLPLNESLELRWRGNAHLGTLGLLLHTCYCVYETLVYLKIGKSIEYYAHHFVVILNYVAALSSGNMQYWAIFCGLVEFTNPFLSVFDMCRLLKATKGLIFKVSGILLWVSFLPFRVLLLPAWLYLHGKDMMESFQTWENTNVVLKYSCIPSVIFLWVLSTFWWTKMTRAMIKMARGKKAADAAAEATGDAKESKHKTN